MQTEQVNFENDDSGDALAERHVSFKTKTYCHFCIIVQASLKPSFLIVLHMSIGIHKKLVKFERQSWPYPP